MIGYMIHFEICSSRSELLFVSEYLNGFTEIWIKELKIITITFHCCHYYDYFYYYYYLYFNTQFLRHMVKDSRNPGACGVLLL